MPRRPTALCAVLMLVACTDSPTTPMNCPDIVRYAVRVLPVDSVSGAAVTSEGWLFAGSHREQLQSWPDTVLVGGAGRSGTMLLLALATGYVPWLSTVRVPRDQCGPITQRIEARLQRP